MKLVKLISLVFGLLLFLFPSVVQGEELFGSNVDNRVLIGFSANADSLGAMLPEGWMPIPFPRGSMKGANVILALEDRLVARDAEGKLADPMMSRAASLVGLAKQIDGDGIRFFVLKVYTTNPNYNTFPGAVLATVDRETMTKGPANGSRERSEIWALEPETGGRIEVALTFITGRPAWVSDESRTFSAADPTVSKIFRYSQLADVVASRELGKPMAGVFTLANSVPELASLFDGTQEVIAIIDMPVYVREVFTP